MAIDRDGEGKERRVESLSSNAALLLDTTIFDNLPSGQRRMYVEGIVRVIMSNDFVTDAGIRCAALRHGDVPLRDKEGNAINNSVGYHGPSVTWPKQTQDVIKGLRRHNFSRLAEQLENRVLNAINIANANYEFFYVNKKGEVNYDPYHSRPTDMAPIDLEVLTGTNLPESTQGWTTAAFLNIKLERGRRDKRHVDASSWEYQIEEELIQQIKHIEAYKTKEEVKRAKPEKPPFLIEVYSVGLSGLSKKDAA
jgi:hypothetical protein